MRPQEAGLRKVPRGTRTVFMLAATICAGCASAPPVSTPGAPQAQAPGLHQTPPGLGQLPFSDADVDFMSGMIPHHAQAVIMAGWAPTHGARKDVAVLCERIVVGQRDEIALMQNWLRDRGLPVPDATSTRMKMTMNGMEHDMLMPGMLTDEEMAALDQLTRAGVRPAVPRRHDQASPGRDRHGRRAVQVVRRGAGRSQCSSSRPTCTPISRSRSIG